ncbi:MAG: HEAT repeat domain-containing protein [Candidatus Hodarchaeales archaeon]
MAGKEISKIQKSLRSRKQKKRQTGLIEAKKLARTRPDLDPELITFLIFHLDIENLNDRYELEKILISIQKNRGTLLPHLKKILPVTTNSVIQSELLKLLVKVADFVPEETTKLTEFLLDTIPQASTQLLFELVVTLGKIGDQLALPVLAQSMQSPYKQIALQAETSYQLICERFEIQPIPVLKLWQNIEQLTPIDDWVKEYFITNTKLEIQCLRGYLLLDPLIKSLAAKNSLQILVEFVPEVIKPEIPILLQHEENTIILLGLSAVEQLNDPEFVPDILPLLVHPHAEDSSLFFYQKLKQVLFQLITPKQLIKMLPFNSHNQTIAALDLMEAELLPDLSSDILPLLTIHYTDIQKRVIQFLGVWANQEVVPILHNMWKQDNKEIRKSLLEILPKFKHELSIPLIIEALQDNVLYDYAWQSFLSLGENLGETELFQVLLELTFWDQEERQWAAIHQIQDFQANESFEKIIQLLYPIPFHALQNGLVKLAGELPENHATLAETVIIHYLQLSNNLNILLPSIGAVIKRQLDSAFPILIQLTDLKKKDLERSLQTALIQLSTTPEKIQILQETLQTKNRYKERLIFHVLAEIATPEAKPLYLAYLRHKDSLIRTDAVRALSSFKDQELISVLLTYLTDKDTQVRYETVKALNYGREETIIPLFNQMDDRKEDVRQEIKITLTAVFERLGISIEILELLSLHPTINNSEERNLAKHLLYSLPNEFQEKNLEHVHNILDVKNPLFKAEIIKLLDAWAHPNSEVTIRNELEKAVYEKRLNSIILSAILESLTNYPSKDLWGLLQPLILEKKEEITQPLTKLIALIGQDILIDLQTIVKGHTQIQARLNVLDVFNQMTPPPRQVISAVLPNLTEKNNNLLIATEKFLSLPAILPAIPNQLHHLRSIGKNYSFKFVNKKAIEVIAQLINKICVNIPNLDFNELTEIEIWLTLIFQTKHQNTRQWLLQQAVNFPRDLKQSLFSLGLNDNKTEIKLLTLQLLQSTSLEPQLQSDVENLLLDKKVIIQQEARRVLERMPQ